MTVRDAIKIFQISQKNAHRKRTTDSYRYLLEHLENHFTDTHVEAITPDQIYQFLGALTEHTAKSTRRLRYAQLKAFFNFLINEKRHSMKNPCQDSIMVKAFKGPRMKQKDTVKILRPGNCVCVGNPMPDTYMCQAMGISQIFPVFPQRFLYLLTFGDVGVGAEHHQWFAVVGSGDEATAVMNPDPVAFLVLHPEFVIVVGQFAREVQLQQFGGLLLVIGVGKRFPCLDAYGGQFIERIADDLRPQLVEDRFPSLDIPFPGAGIGAFDDARQPPVCVSQSILSLFPLGDFGDRNDPGGVSSKHHRGARQVHPFHLTLFGNDL